MIGPGEQHRSPDIVDPVRPRHPTEASGGAPSASRATFVDPDSMRFLRTIAPALLCIACQSRAAAVSESDTAGRGSGRAATAASGSWVTVMENPEIRMSLDTSRFTRVDGRYRVWLGFDLATPWPAIEDLKAPYRHYEAHQELDCAGTRARGLAMHLVDTTGTRYEKPAPDSLWTSFATHPLPADALQAVCRQLASRGVP